MPRFTKNENGMPQIMADAMFDKPYNPCGASDYSATSLICPPQQVQLMKRHPDVDGTDIKDGWLMWLGNAVHAQIEHDLKNNPEYMVERKITRFDEGRRVVAKFDAYHIPTKTIYDHKTTTVAIAGNEAKDEWVQQLNINAYFLEEEGYKVDAAKINAIYMDWRPGTAKFKSAQDYPQVPAKDVPTFLMSQEKRKTFYEDRLKKHVAAESLPDEKLPPCTAEETWESPSVYAVHTKGIVRARKLCATEDEAKAWIESNKSKFANLEIHKRPAIRRRCADYCSASSVCQQYKKWLEENGEK